MGDGDSVMVFIVLDILLQKFKGFENIDVMYYDLVIVDIKFVQDYVVE